VEPPRPVVDGVPAILHDALTSIRETSTMAVHTNAVTSAAFSPDGKRVVTASNGPERPHQLSVERGIQSRWPAGGDGVQRQHRAPVGGHRRPGDRGPEGCGARHSVRTVSGW